MMKNLAILGSTGSIGHSTLSIVEAYPERFGVVTMAAGHNLQLAFEQALRWRPRLISRGPRGSRREAEKRLRAAGAPEVEVVWGSQGTVAVATHPEADFVVSAIVGVAGLEATYAAVKAGKALGAGQQGMPGRRRRADHGRGAPAEDAAASHRQRTQCHSSVHARRAAARGGVRLAYRFRRAFPEHAIRRILPPSRWSRRSIIPPGRWAAASPLIRPP